jgi:hypothetical protein
VRTRAWCSEGAAAWVVFLREAEFESEYVTRSLGG